MVNPLQNTEFNRYFIIIAGKKEIKVEIYVTLLK
ncbi:MAG: hypothetical protein PWQ67_2171 [Clostridia bacterium]|jgi:hypothetical protein|nr:hypothetical protein [Clostridia bacterium]